MGTPSPEIRKESRLSQHNRNKDIVAKQAENKLEKLRKKKEKLHRRDSIMRRSMTGSHCFEFGGKKSDGGTVDTEDLDPLFWAA